MPRAFAGIELSAAQRTRARAIIEAAYAEALAMDHRSPNLREQSDAMLRRRNLALRALLETEAERRRFDLNIEALQ